MKPLITIYTPTYHRNKLLQERAIPSVLNQTYKNFEYVIVHDGEDDNNLKQIVESYDDPRIRYFAIPRVLQAHDYDNEKQWFIGASYPSNFALYQARGAWIARLDDDDSWTPDCMESLLRFAIEGDYEFVSAQYEAMQNGKKEIIGADENGIGGVQTWLYRGYLKKFKYDPNCHEKAWNRVNDIDLSVRMKEAGVRMGFLEKVVAFVYPRPGESFIGLKAVRDKIQQQKR